MNTNQELTILADGEQISRGTHTHLYDRRSLGLFPSVGLLHLWNLSDSDFALLSRAGSLSVFCGDSLLAFGAIVSAYQRPVSPRTLTEVSFSAEKALWSAPVSLSVPAGVSASDTVRRLLAASGSGISLLSWAGADPVFARGQAFLGGAGTCLETVLSAAGARGVLTPGGLTPVWPSSGSEVTLLSDADLRGTPRPVPEGAVLPVSVAGWQVGQHLSLPSQRLSGLVSALLVDADTAGNPWKMELLLEI